MKSCLDCGIPASDATHYRPPSWGGVFSSRCKECDKARAKQWKLNNPEKHKETHRRWRLQALYGITPERWKQMLEEQNGGCAICSATEPGARDWHVDHDHESGKVRGLLCHACNTAYTEHVERNMENLYEYHCKHACPGGVGL